MIHPRCTVKGCPFEGGYCRIAGHMKLPAAAKKEAEQHQEKEKDKKKNQKPIPKESASRKQLNKVYNKIIREKKKVKNRKCKIRIKGVCIGQPVHQHHVKGRVGNNLVDTEEMIDACDACNEWCVSHPKEAMAMGFIKSRLTESKLSKLKKQDACG